MGQTCIHTHAHTWKHMPISWTKATRWAPGLKYWLYLSNMYYNHVICEACKLINLLLNTIHCHLNIIHVYRQLLLIQAAVIRLWYRSHGQHHQWELEQLCSGITTRTYVCTYIVTMCGWINKRKTLNYGQYVHTCRCHYCVYWINYFGLFVTWDWW